MLKRVSDCTYKNRLFLHVTKFRHHMHQSVYNLFCQKIIPLQMLSYSPLYVDCFYILTNQKITLCYSPCGNRTRKLIEIRTDSPSCNREPVGLSDQESARNVTLVWLRSRHEGWSGTGRATRSFSGYFLEVFLIALKFHLIHNRTSYQCILPQFFELFCVF